MSSFKKSLLFSASFIAISLSAPLSLKATQNEPIEVKATENSLSYSKIRSLEFFLPQLDDLKEKGSIFILDIDGVMLSEGGEKSAAQLLDKVTLKFLKALNKKRIPCFGLTARSHENNRASATFKHLKNFGIDFNNVYPIDFNDEHAKYYKGILFSPNNKTGLQKISTKLSALKKFLDHFEEKYKTIQNVFFIDNEAFHFSRQDEGLLNFKQSLNLFEFQREFHPSFKAVTSAETKAPNLSHLAYLESLEGGAGGVVLLIDGAGKLWTLKIWKNTHHGINECLGASLYKKMGGYAPDFYIYNDIPEQLKKNILEDKNQGGNTNLTENHFYRLAEYIEGKEPTAKQLKDSAADHFLPTALISFWDAKPENYIITDSNQLYLIDTGGSLLYRALGELKKPENSWMAHQVSELFTLRNGKQAIENTFVNINPQDWQNKLGKILSLRGELLKELKSLCDATHYKDKRIVHDMIESRLNHLQFLSDFFNNKINIKADPFALAHENDAAGTLIYAKDNNNAPHILLGQRAGHSWWGNLGGKADAGEYLYEVAGRETLEESGGVIDVRNKIQFSPSHDIMYLDKEFLLRRYRTYLVETSYIDSQLLKDEEYYSYKWFPVKEILETLEDRKEIEAEGQKTLQLADGTILHPPFVESLQQSQIKQWLIALDQNESKEIKGTATQGLFGNPHLEFFEADIESQDSDRQRFILAFNALAKQRKIPKSLISIKSHKEDLIPASYAMLEYLSKKNGLQEEANLATQLNFVIKRHYFHYNAELIKTIIEKEELHKNMNVFYHGLRPEIWYCYRVLSNLRHMLNQTITQTTVLRSMDFFFDEFPSASDLLNYIIKGNDNYSPGYQAVGLSCNPTLFSNLYRETSSTLNYFLKGASQVPPEDIWQITETLFSKLGLLNTALSENLKKTFKECMKTKPGCLIQIFLDPSITNQAVYPAVEAGKILADKDGNIIRDATKVIKTIRKGEKISLETPLNEVQMRLHADLSKFETNQIKVYDYFADGDQKRLNNIDQAIRNTLKDYIPEILKKAIHPNDIYGSKYPALSKIMKTHFKIEPFELTNENPLTKILIENDYQSIIQHYLENPGQFNFSYTDSGKLMSQNARDHILVKVLKNYSKELIIEVLQSKIINEGMKGYDIRDIFESFKECGDEIHKLLTMAKSNEFINESSSARTIKEVITVIKNLGQDAEKSIKLLKDSQLVKKPFTDEKLKLILPLIGNLGQDAEKIIEITKNYQFFAEESNYTKLEDYVKEINSTFTFIKNLGPNAEKIMKLALESKLIKLSEKSDKKKVIEYFKLFHIQRNFAIMKEYEIDIERFLEIGLDNNLFLNISEYDFRDLVLSIKNLGDEASKIIKTAKKYNIIDRDGGHRGENIRILQFFEPFASDAVRIMDMAYEFNFIGKHSVCSKVINILTAIRYLGWNAEKIITIAKDRKLITNFLRDPYREEALKEAERIFYAEKRNNLN